MTLVEKLKRRSQRKRRVRAKVKGTSVRPRLSVFRSNKHVFIQLIDDEKAKTIISVSDMEIGKSTKPGSKKERSFIVGELLAKKAIAKKIQKVVFDKGGYKYHGRVEGIAEGARKGGLEF